MTDSGAHCKQRDMNRQSLGICVIGNYDRQTVPTDVWDKTVGLVQSLITVFDIPVENVKGHRDYAPKSCPGKMFDLDKFRSNLKP